MCLSCYASILLTGSTSELLFVRRGTGGVLVGECRENGAHNSYYLVYEDT